MRNEIPYDDVAWGWNWFEIVWRFRHGERCGVPSHVWLAERRGFRRDDPVLPFVLPLEGCGNPM